MSDERTAETPSGLDVALTDEEKERLSQEQAEFRAKAAMIVSRSSTQEALRVELPPDLYGEWIFNSPDSIAEAQFKGFVFDEKYAIRNQQVDHSKGDGRAYRGDTVFMVMPKWKHDILDEESQKRKDAVHGTRGDRKKQEEEKAYLADAKKGRPDAIIPFNESSSTTVLLDK